MPVFQNPGLNECSGIAISRFYADLAIVQNDENVPLWLLQLSTGNFYGRLGVGNHSLNDPESLSIGTDGNIFIWDGGDGGSNPVDRGLLWRAEVSPGNYGGLSWNKALQRYPGSERPNSEAHVVRPNTGEQFVFTKQVSGSRIFQIGTYIGGGHINHLTQVATIPHPLVSDACFSPDGTLVAIVNQNDDNIHIYRYLGPSSWTHIRDVPAPHQPQREGIAFTWDQLNMWITSERPRSAYYEVPVPVDLQIAPPPPNPDNPCGNPPPP